MTDDLTKRVKAITKEHSARTADAIVAAAAPEGFHWRDGIFFRVTPDGAVEVVETRRRNPLAGGPTLPDRALAVIPRREWQSITDYIATAILAARTERGEDNPNGR